MHDALDQIAMELSNLKTLMLKELSAEKAVLITVDMVKGFAEKGALYSDRIEGIIPAVARINRLMKSYEKLFFVDSHDENSVEFKNFPPHCTGEESLLVEPLRTLAQQDERALVITKNCTNGFHARGFQNWLSSSADRIRQYVIIGDCTDICVLQLALTIKAWHDERNVDVQVIVPISAVETYDLELTHHNAELMNVMALYIMKMNGIEIVKDIVEV